MMAKLLFVLTDLIAKMMQHSTQSLCLTNYLLRMSDIMGQDWFYQANVGLIQSSSSDS
jgi:hypothetical protein